MRITRFADLPQFLAPGDILVRNNVAVLPARLVGQRPTGGKVECFLLRPATNAKVWECLLRPGKKLQVGAIFSGDAGDYRAEVVGKTTDGTALVAFSHFPDASVSDLAQRIGAAPLPPYIRRQDKAQGEQDKIRYQTVYADPDQRTAVAAPTAGLHFSADLLGQLQIQGVRTADITLQVGLGTFRPITTATLGEHQMHRESYEISPATQAVIRQNVGTRFCVGTTTVRTVEDFLRRTAPDPLQAFRAETEIFIYPPFHFLGCDHLITNFHQPRSTLLCLVAAFLTPQSDSGIDWLREIYREALARGYRFLSYGDSMLIL